MTPSAEPASEQTQAPTSLVPARLLQDGEIIILAIKPSNWFVLIGSLPWLGSAAVVAVFAYVVSLWHASAHQEVIWSLCAAAVLVGMVAACWQWLGRTYVLTNRRIIAIRGLLRVQWVAAELTDVEEVTPAAALPERLVGTGSIFCLTGPDRSTAVAWNTISRPGEVHEIILDAIDRAKRASQSPRGRSAAP